MYLFPMTLTWRLCWSIKLVIVRLNNINHNGEHDKRKLTHQLLDKPKLKFSFFGKITGKKNSAGKLLRIILPIVSVAVIAVVVLCIWIVCKKRTSQGTNIPHRRKSFV